MCDLSLARKVRVVRGDPLLGLREATHCAFQVHVYEFLLNTNL